MKNIIRYTGDFVIERFVISRFHCMFAITRFRYIEVLFHTFDYYWDEEYHSLYQGLRYIEIRYIEVPLSYFLLRKVQFIFLAIATGIFVHM